MTPFVKAVTRALSIELKDPEQEEKEAIFEEILRNLPKESTSIFLNNLSHNWDTLQLGEDQSKRINLQ